MILHYYVEEISLESSQNELTEDTMVQPINEPKDKQGSIKFIQSSSLTSPLNMSTRLLQHCYNYVIMLWQSCNNLIDVLRGDVLTVIDIEYNPENKYGKSEQSVTPVTAISE